MRVHRFTEFVLAIVLALITSDGMAQDWPQWRGLDRDGKANFKAPENWPQEFTLQWKVTVGDGVATPALVGDRLYVFSREDGSEVTRCLEATSGKEIWIDEFETRGASGPARGFPGPRSSPTVAEGKVVTLGARGMLSCLDANTGKKLWRKDEFEEYPMFHPASSPLVTNGLCIAQLGGQRNGSLVAYDLVSGEKKWQWQGGSPEYASPVLMNIGDSQLVIAKIVNRIVAIGATDGKLMWEMPYKGGWITSTPIVGRDTLFFTDPDRGTRAIKFETTADGIQAKDLWKNDKISVQYNTPVLKDGLLYGLSKQNEFFCLDARDGKTVWSAPTGGGGDYGSIVDAGSVLLALTPHAKLIAFQPGDKKYVELARIRVADSETYAYPVVSGNRIFIKDKGTVRLWTIQ
ncbi:MAG: outer membrane protein assembly factor BamB [Pseudoalteromonas tetraodonis]|jgi:outer membrane protein assembly factor BamB